MTKLSYSMLKSGKQIQRRNMHSSKLGPENGLYVKKETIPPLPAGTF